MSISFTINERFGAPPERVFAALIDLEEAASWLPNFVAIKRLQPGPLAVGHTWRETRRIMGKEATEYLEVTELEAPTRLGLRIDGSRGSSGKGEYLFDYTLAASDDGTNLTLMGEIRGMGRVMSLLGRVFSIAYRRAVAKDLTALHSHLEGKDYAAGGPDPAHAG